MDRFRLPAFVLILLSSGLLLTLAGCNPPGQGVSGEPPRNASTSVSVETEPGPVVRRQAAPSSADYPDTGVDLGWGWDSELGAAKPSVCVEFALAADKGQTKRLSVSEVSDSYEMMRSLGMSAAVSVKTAGYKASGKAEFAKDTRVSGFDSNFVLRASVDNGVLYAAPVAGDARARPSPAEAELLPDQGAIRLTPQALRLAQRRDLNAFFNLCGDSFVSALYGGAELVGMVSIHTNSRQEKQNASTSFSGSGWGVDAEGKATSSAFSGFKSEQMSLSFFQTGGSRDKIPASKEDFLAKLDTLSAEAEDAPKFYRIALLPYSVLENWPEKELLVATAELDQLASYWGDYQSLYTGLDEVLADPGAFCRLKGCEANKGLGDDELTLYRELQDEVQTALRGLRDDSIRCARPDQEGGEECRFDETRYLPAHAYRIQLPLRMSCTTPKNGARTCIQGEVTNKDKDSAVRQTLQVHLLGPVRSRCQMDPVDAECLSNAAITDWRGRIGSHLVLLEEEELRALKERQAAAMDDESKLDWFSLAEQPPHAWVAASAGATRAKARGKLLALLVPAPPAPQPGE